MKLTKTIEKALVGVPRTLAAGRKFYVIGPHCWGRGVTIEEAHTNAYNNRARIYEGKPGWRFLLYDAPADAWVNEIHGGLEWNIPAGADADTVAAKLLAKFNITEAVAK